MAGAVLCVVGPSPPTFQVSPKFFIYSLARCASAEPMISVGGNCWRCVNYWFCRCRFSHRKCYKYFNFYHLCQPLTRSIHHFCPQSKTKRAMTTDDDVERQCALLAEWDSTCQPQPSLIQSPKCRAEWHEWVKWEEKKNIPGCHKRFHKTSNNKNASTQTLRRGIESQELKFTMERLGQLIHTLMKFGFINGNQSKSRWWERENLMN